MTETIILLQKLLDCTLGISLAHIPNTEQAISDYFHSFTFHGITHFLQRDHAFIQQLRQMPMQEDTLYEYRFLECVTLLAASDKQRNSVLILGPALTAPFSREDVLQFLKRHRIPAEIQPFILQFCSNLPVVPTHILYRAGDLVISHITNRNEPMRIEQVSISAPAEKYVNIIQPSDHTLVDIAQMRQIELRYEFSAALTDAVKQGNLSLALYIVGQHTPDQQNPARNSNPLRNAQNYCIVLNTQLRHALQESGIHPYQVDRLSNEIGMEIERLKNISQVPAFFQQIIRRYCRLVQEHTYPNLKPLTNLAMTYIKEHLSDNITVKDAAKALTVNANYLSSLFHQEMGMTFIDFVNQERTNQAAVLLKDTNLQIQQIASIVGYNNTSYFSKQFLRFHGVNPRHYRKNGV